MGSTMREIQLFSYYLTILQQSCLGHTLRARWAPQRRLICMESLLVYGIIQLPQLSQETSDVGTDPCQSSYTAKSVATELWIEGRWACPACCSLVMTAVAATRPKAASDVMPSRSGSVPQHSNWVIKSRHIRPDHMATHYQD